MKKVNLKLWRDIRQQKWQFTALVVIILLGVLSYGGMMGMIDDVEASLDHTLNELRFQDFVVSLEGRRLKASCRTWRAWTTCRQ
jgi:hypothetical protein